MNRLIVPHPAPGRAQMAGGSDADKILGRLVKYIPGEVISGYMVLAGLIDAANQDSPLRAPAAWSLVGLGVLLTPSYLWKIGRPVGVQIWQLPISTVSFVLWAFALGGPFRTLSIHGYKYESWFAVFLAGAFSWVIAAVWTPTEPAPKP